jgi:lysophospholipase L1-like esterase
MKLLRPLAAAVVVAALMVSPAHAAAKPPKPTATIAVSTTTPAEGESIPVSGTVSQVPAGTLVAFQHSLGSGGWVADKSLSVDAAGHYSTTYTAVLGPNKIRTNLPAQGTRRAATSPVITVTGSLGITPKAPTTTDQVRVEATLPTPVARTVLLQTSEASGWVTRTTGQSTTSGRFALTATFATSVTIRVIAPKIMSQGKRLYAEFDGPSQRVEVAPSGLMLTPTPTVVGTAALDETLTVATGAWDPGVVLTYQWLRSGASIPGETGNRHVVTAADVGAQLAVRVTGTKPGATPVSRTSALTSVVAPGLLETSKPVVLGTPQQFAVLTADPGQWGPTPVIFAYQWLRDDAPIDGATQASYTLSDQDTGSLLQVRVTGTKPGYAAETTTSDRVGVPGPQSASKVARALRTFHAALLDVDQEPVDIFAGPSDSLTEGFAATSVDKRWTNVLTNDLRTSYEPAGVAGGLGYADPINFGAFPDYPISFVRGIGNFTIGLGREGLALFDPESQSITVDDTYSDLDILYTGRSDGSYGWFSYTVDGGAPVIVHTGDKSVSGGGYVAKISDLGLGHHVVVIRVSPGHGPAMIEGVMLYSGDRSSGVRMWEGGHNGLTAADYVAPNGGWADSLAVVQPDLVVLPIGSNDFALGTSAADTRTRIEEIIRMIRSHVDTNPSIVLLSYYNRPSTGSAPWSTYADMYRSIAAADPDVCVFDLDPLLGPYKTDTRATLMSADWLHPSDAGYSLIGNALADFLTAP